MDMPENTKAVDTWLLVALVKVLMVDALTKHVLDVAMVAVVTLAVLMDDETVVAEDLVDAILAVAVVVLLVAVVVAMEAVLMLVVAVPTLLMATMLISWMLLAIRAIRRIKLEINKTWVKLVSRMIHLCISATTLATLRVQMIMVITESFRVRVEVLLVLALVKMVVLPGVMKHQGTLPGRHTQATNPAM